MDDQTDVVVHYLDGQWQIESGQPGEGEVSVAHLSPFSTLGKLVKGSVCLKSANPKSIVSCLISKGIGKVSGKFLEWLVSLGVDDACARHILESGGVLTVAYNALSGPCVQGAGESGFTIPPGYVPPGGVVPSTAAPGNQPVTAAPGNQSSVPSTCSFSDAGNGQDITAAKGSTFTDTLGNSWSVGGDCALTQTGSAPSTCSFSDAGNGQDITAAKGSTFTDTLGNSWSVGGDCALTPI